MSWLGVGRRSVYPNSPHGPTLDLRDVDQNGIHGRANGGYVGLRAQLHLGHPMPVATLDTKAKDAGHSTAVKAPGEHRGYSPGVFVWTGRPERVLVVPDATPKVALRTAPVDACAESDGHQAHPMHRARRDGLIQLDV
jgi:hypothetical protein